MDILPRISSRAPQQFVSDGEVTYFTVYVNSPASQIWSTDCTAQGTKQITNLQDANHVIIVIYL